ncbi:MAG: ATP-binding protein [Actinomycetota bacterium]
MTNVIVSVPARPEFVHIVRTVVAGTAAKALLGLDQIDDVRLAVDEACAHLLTHAPNATTLTVDITHTGPELQVIARVDQQISSEPQMESITWHILSALTDEAEVEPSPAGTGIRISKLIHQRS